MTQTDPVAALLDHVWADHMRRYADVYAFGGKLLRERELREAAHQHAEGHREPVGERNRKIARILARDGEACCYCNEPLGEDMTLEHRIARSRGGTDDLDNLTLAHARCNREVGNLPPDMKDELAKRKSTTREAGSAEQAPVVNQ